MSDLGHAEEKLFDLRRENERLKSDLDASAELINEYAESLKTQKATIDRLRKLVQEERDALLKEALAEKELTCQPIAPTRLDVLEAAIKEGE